MIGQGLHGIVSLPSSSAYPPCAAAPPGIPGPDPPRDSFPPTHRPDRITIVLKLGARAYQSQGTR
eukprot:2974887-Pyramimonas_sp.AAC.1